MVWYGRRSQQRVGPRDLFEKSTGGRSSDPLTVSWISFGYLLIQCDIPRAFNRPVHRWRTLLQVKDAATTTAKLRHDLSVLLLSLHRPILHSTLATSISHLTLPAHSVNTPAFNVGLLLPLQSTLAATVLCTAAAVEFVPIDTDKVQLARPKVPRPGLSSSTGTPTAESRRPRSGQSHI